MLIRGGETQPETTRRIRTLRPSLQPGQSPLYSLCSMGAK